VTYYLRGGSLVNFVAIEQQTEWSAEGWSAQGDPEIMRRGFSGWHPDVTRLLDHVDETFVWGLFSRTERIRWVDGPAVLLGDAAHPMLPFMAQGAAMALEDVAILVRELRGDIDLPDALAAYEKRRWPRVMRVAQRSRANEKLFHQRSGTVRSVHRGLVSAVTRWAPGLAAAQLDWLYGYDVTGETG
jgi:salicylate hydroxylase